MKLDNKLPWVTAVLGSDVFIAKVYVKQSAFSEINITAAIS